ncbi:helix-turn-helix domain-containing protein [Flavobacterium terrisoli]|uniref:helix-turn-helix domain-containing protein n=1 Tax=Flavobacterium terrisoli TaxID=3242195 RepID=UPI0025432C60|nr:helix-turn-helix domain-containing protein [Flavobacterium buctense]
MKYLIKINRYFYFFLLFGFLHSNSNAQSLNKHYLADDVENLIHSNPDQALKIAQYLLSKTNTTNNEKARVNFLISKAYLVKGDYSSALNFLYEEKNYEDYLSEKERINIEIDKINLLRELTLDKQAKKILENLENTFGNSTDSRMKLYLDLAVAIEKAKFLAKEGKAENGITLLQKQIVPSEKVLVNAKELQPDFIITFGQLYLEQRNFTEAQKYFEMAIEMINKRGDQNVYTKIEALHGLAKVYFLKKEHQKATSFDEEAMSYAKNFNNLFWQVKIIQQQNVSYLALGDMANYKQTNTKFFELQSETEAQEQEAINTAYNLISDEYSEEYNQDKANYLKIVYVVSGLFLIVILVCVFFWQKIVQRKKGLDVIINYIEITRSNLLGSFSITDKKHEPRKNIILKETEEQILNKLKRFESSKRFINKDISLAVLAGQLDSNTKYLSEIINTHYNVNFNTYINKLRINYIIEKLKTDPNFINYKISYLAENCGFSSHSSFATVFKSITGISPVKFIELLNQEKENNLLEE